MRHGGDLREAVARSGRPASAWIDLSTGINPLSYPLPVIADGAWTRLPQAARETALLDAARAAYRVPAPAAVVAGPGTQILIQLAARLRAPGRVAVVGPTYSEHALAWGREGHAVDEVASLEQAATYPAAILVNPNNPDARRWSPAEVVAAARAMADRGGLLVVDEAFMDVEPPGSVIPHFGEAWALDLEARPERAAHSTDAAGLVVLRSFGKFYGLAGVRLGFAVGGSTAMSRMAGWLGPWAVAGPALEIGVAALADEDWAAAARNDIAIASQRLAAVLAAHGLTVEGNAGLYVLARTPAAAAVREALADAGIWVRWFNYRPDWLRFGLPGSEAEFARLEAALGAARLTASRRPG